MGGGAEHEIVIVGAGAAGCVIARRLAEAGRDVLLLEAGPDLRDVGQPDLRDGWRLPKTVDWGYESEPGASGDPEPLRRVRGVGGTSWMTRFAARGSPADFDAWAAAGNDGWDFDAVLPFFRGLETDAEYGDRPWHGSAGPIPVTRYPDDDVTEIHASLVEAAVRRGFPAVEDHNAPGAVGIGRLPMNSRGGSRVTTADGYLRREASPMGPDVKAETQTARVLLEAGRAAGVVLVDGSVIRAGRVVLAAGTYGSPAILMRSGIGPAGHLWEVGIPVVMDLPGVGSNLTDHPGVDIDLGWDGPAKPPPTLHSIATFHSSAKGTTDPPDMMFWISDPVGDPASAEVDVVLLKPRSRGVVRLRSSDPEAAPRIELPGVRDQHDVERLAEGFRHGWEIVNDGRVRQACARPSTPLPSGPGVLEAFVRANAYSIPHVVGTCAMGREPDDGAVVDAAGRVHGVDGLYVADASIMPDAPSGFPHLVTIMIAEAIAARSFRV